MPKTVTSVPGDPSVAGSTGSTVSVTSVCPAFLANAPRGTITVTWLSDVTDSRYVVSDMMSKVVNENMAIEDAQAWAHEQMMDSYNKITKRS